jgi:poly-gamma-glutamate capsule biosynthesis protein CapA/YwtB (metallophosphatase superfamily)
MCGDVMTGRGIDQMLPNPSEPTLYEPYMKSARGYVTLAEEINGRFSNLLISPMSGEMPSMNLNESPQI